MLWTAATETTTCFEKMGEAADRSVASAPSYRSLALRRLILASATSRLGVWSRPSSSFRVGKPTPLLDTRPTATEGRLRAETASGSLRCSPTVGRFGGLVKFGSGSRHAASFAAAVGPYASSGVRPARVECGRRTLLEPIRADSPARGSEPVSNARR